MKTTIKNISDTKVQVTVGLDSTELESAKQVATLKLSRSLKLPGFRKGKAPLSAVASSVNPVELQDEIINNAISKSVAEAFLDNQLQALDRPVVEVKKFVPDESLEFTAEAEILPKVKLGNYKKLKVNTEKIVVAKKDVDDIIDRMRTVMAKKTLVEREAKLTDEVVIDFVGKRDGEAFEGGTSKDYELKLGSNQFIPGFETGIVGHKAGDKFDLDLTFPADYGSAELRGQKVVFEVTLNKVNELSQPEVDDEFAAKVGSFKTVKELKEDIEKELTLQKEREQKEKIKDDLVKQLIEASQIPIPEILVKDQMESIEKDFLNNLAHQGLTLDDYINNKGFESREKWLETEVKDAATLRVKSGLVLAELSKAEKVSATSEELEAHANSYKQQYANNKEALKQFDQPEVRRDIAGRLITEKTVDLLVSLNSK